MINMEWTWHDWRLQRRDEKPCPIPSWNVAHRNAKCRPLSDIYEDILLCIMYASLSSISNLRWFSFHTILRSSTCFCFCCRCYCHLSLLYPCLLMFMRLYLWAILVKSSVACGVYWFWTATLGWNDTFLPNQLESSIIIWVNFKALIKQVSPHKTSSQIAKI